MSTSERLPYARQEGHGARNRGERLVIIANPRSAGGRTGALRERLERAAARAFEQVEIRWTEGPGHAAELAGAAAEAAEAAGRADIVAAFGGDGTCHEVVNGLAPLGRLRSRRIIFAVIPSGTGGDLRRSLETPEGLEAALWVASTGVTLPLDVGVVEREDGAALLQRVFINVAGIGMNAEVCRHAERSGKRFGGPATFLSAIAASMRDYRPMRARWRWEGPEGQGDEEIETLAAFCANGHWCGAGLWVGRDGSMADGLFDLTILRPFSALQLPGMLPRAWAGTLGDLPGARRVRAWKVEVAPIHGAARGSGRALPVELDGEPQADVSGSTRIALGRDRLQVRGGWLRPPVPSTPS